MEKEHSPHNKHRGEADINLLECKLLGKGHNGIVYLLPDGRVIKVCFDVKSCRGEYNILKKVQGNKYFPRVYELGGNYMIRDYVGGEPLNKYIKKNGLSRKLALDIIELLEEFRKLHFSKIDIRCKDIFIEPNGVLKIIDPKKCFTKKRDFPRHLSKGLENLGALDYFLEVLSSERPKLYKHWKSKISRYIEERFGE